GPEVEAAPTLPQGATPPSLPEVSAYGGDMKRLADCTTIITLPQRRGAATDLAVRAARLALGIREGRSHRHIVIATGRGIPRARVRSGGAADRAGARLRAHAERGGGPVWLDEVTAGLLDPRFRVRRPDVGDDADGQILDGEAPTIDPSRPLLGRPTACVGREHELVSLELALQACIEESSPRALLVVGPPGIGKSRLRHELLRRSQSRPEP